MSLIKKILSVVMLLIFAFVFFIAIIQMPVKAIADIIGEGTYCNVDKNKYCWTSKPRWECLDLVGGEKCVDPQPQ